MTTEQLMAKRYEVIADYPGNRFKVGAIFTKDIDSTFVDEHGNVTLESNLKTFTNIFKPLQWWEKRIFVDPGLSGKYVKEFDLMPQFIKSKSTGHIYKVIWYSVDALDEVNCLVETENGSKHRALPDMDISSQSEYDQYIKSILK